MLIHATSPLCWQVIGLTVGELFGSIFVNTTIMGIADVVANILLILILPRFPRQILHSLNFAALGISLVTSSVLRGFFYDSTRLIDVILMIIAKFFSSSKCLYIVCCSIDSSYFTSRLRNGIFGDIRSLSHRCPIDWLRLRDDAWAYISHLLQLYHACRRRWSIAMGITSNHGHIVTYIGFFLTGAA